MDIKNPYNPDKSTRKEKVLIALNGSIDAAVAAYLLKIQKYELMAVTVINSWEASPQNQSELFSCHINAEKLQKIKDFCHTLSIPHIIISNGDSFYEEVIDQWFASKLCGIKDSACLNCHKLRMHLLHQKMIEVGAKFLATGHYAKIFTHEGHDSVYVHSANEESDDKSAELSRLPHDVLKSLLLPLSDLQRKEVLKLAENFGLSENHSQQVWPCFTNSKQAIETLSAQIPDRFKASGSVVTAADPAHVSEHLGVLYYQVGEEVSLLKPGQKLFLKRYNPSNQVMEASLSQEFLRHEVQLVDCHFAEETYWEGPQSGVVKLGLDFVDCWIYPKNLNSVHVVWDENKKILEREVVAVYKKRGRNSKLLLTGSVRYISRMDEGEEDSEKVDYSSDI